MWRASCRFPVEMGLAPSLPPLAGRRVFNFASQSLIPQSNHKRLNVCSFPLRFFLCLL